MERHEYKNFTNKGPIGKSISVVDSMFLYILFVKLNNVGSLFHY